MIPILTKAGFAFFLRHPMQLFLSVLGIAIGVAVIVAVDIAQQSAFASFHLSLTASTGRATHSIHCYPVTCEDSLYKQIRTELGVKSTAPVIDTFVRLSGSEPTQIRLLALDPFADNPFRNFLQPLGKFDKALHEFISNPNSVFISEKTAKQHGLKQDGYVKIQVGGINKVLRIIGFLRGESISDERLLENLLIMDIGGAQKILEIPGRLSRIDLMVADQDIATIPMIQKILPQNAQILAKGKASRDVQTMTQAFRTNLKAMSLLSLIVGGFLIFNTISFSVMQRRETIGLLRALGASRKEIFFLVIQEAFLFGWFGSLLGILLGIAISSSFLSVILQTINNLYFTTNLQNHQIPFSTLSNSFFLGMGIAIFSSLIPALEMAKIEPRQGMLRSVSEQNLLRRLPLFAGIGLSFVTASGLITLLPGKGLINGFLALFFLIIGLSLSTPVIAYWIVHLSLPFLHRYRLFHWKMGIQSISRYMSRSGLAIASLAIAISVVIGVGTMIESFRATVQTWLASRLSADIYITAPGNIRLQTIASLPYSLVTKLKSLSGVEEISYFREVSMPTSIGTQRIRAFRLGNAKTEQSFLREKRKPVELLWKKMESEPIAFISQSLAYKHNINLGQTILLYGKEKSISFVVEGVYDDYSSDQGQISISDAIYRQYWDDTNVSGISLFLNKRTLKKQVEKEILAITGPNRDIVMQSGRSLLEYSIDIFDKTFIITYMLQFIAILVAFIAILSSLMALQLERKREFGILRALGLSRKSLFVLILIQTGVTGIIAGVLAIPLGNAMSFILIHVINRRSFGWDFPFIFQPDLQLYAIILAIVSSLGAALYPAFALTRIQTADALHEE